MSAESPVDATSVTLCDGSTVTVRQIRPDDKAVLSAGFKRLSAESRYRRFLTPMPKLNKSALAYLTEVNHHDHEALLALDAHGNGVGVARYVRRDASDAAEAAVAVIDDWQGRGVGTLLLELLADRAREEGVRRPEHRHARPPTRAGARSGHRSRAGDDRGRSHAPQARTGQPTAPAPASPRDRRDRGTSHVPSARPRLARSRQSRQLNSAPHANELPIGMVGADGCPQFVLPPARAPPRCLAGLRAERIWSAVFESP